MTWTLRIMALCATLMLAASVWLISDANAAPIGEHRDDTPSGTVTSVVAAINASDIKKVVLLTQGGAASDLLLPLERDLKIEPYNITVKSISEVISCKSAKVTIITDWKFKGSKGESKEVINLVKTDKDWIVATNMKPDSTESLQIVNGFSYLVSHPITMDNAKETQCHGNMMQICIALLEFAQDHNEKFDLTAANYVGKIKPYIKDNKIFHCPSVTGKDVPYAFNKNLNSIFLAQVESPSTTVMVYEGKDGKLDFRHSGKSYVGFIDGRTKLIDAAGAAKLRWKP